MRIIAGTLKGRRLKSPIGINTRPTTDRIKESLFNILNPYLAGSYVMDLFAGTGNLGIEALSRGAEKAVFVDNHRSSIRIIKENLELTGFNDKSTILYQEALKAIQDFSLQKEKFDIIFMDPPYLKGHILPCMDTIVQEKILALHGLIVVEHDSKEILPEEFKTLNKYKYKRYGNTTISIYSEEA